jgi:hypothetical protein
MRFEDGRDAMSSKKESAVMTLKSQVANQVADVVSKIEQRAEELPANIDEARKKLSSWSDRAGKLVRKNPGLVLLGAFAIGFVLAKAARHA